MIQPARMFWGRRSATALCGALGVLFVVFPRAAASADGKPSVEGEVRPAGHCVAVTGALLERAEKARTWKVVKPREAVAAGALLLALPGSKVVVDGRDESVRLTLLGNLPVVLPIPLLESAIVLRAPGKDVNLDFTLARGRVIVENRARKGPVVVRARFQDQKWSLILRKPGAQAAIEIVARWIGQPSSVEKPRKSDTPDVRVFLVVLNGEVSVEADGSEFLLRAPPGPAFFRWRDGQGTAGPTRLKEQPPWAKTEASKTTGAKAARARVEKMGRALEKSPVSAGLREGLESKDSLTRILAVYSLGAIDDLPAVLDSLENKTQQDVRLAAVDELRHWVGRDADHMPALFKALREKEYSAAQARIAISLLQRFSPRQIARPETYELLIEYLKHDRLAIRELAIWHLIGMAPEEARTVKYDPAADAPKRKLAYARWKKELPDGQLPRKPKPRPIKKD